MYEFSRKTIVATPKDTSKLKLFYKGREVQEDVVASQVVIWNAGTAAVTEDMILDKVKLSIVPEDLTIFEVKTVEKTREITGFKFDEQNLKKGVIPLSWKILEPGDGALLQVIHSKGEGSSFLIDGIIVSQGDLKKYQGTFVHKIFGFNAEPKSNTLHKYVYVFFVLLGLLIVVPSKKEIEAIKERNYARCADAFFGVVGGIFCIIIGVMNMLSPVSPF